MFPLDNRFNYRVRLEPKTADGQPARVDGAPTWSLDNEDACTLQVEGDGLSALIVTADSGDEIRQATLHVEADADLGSGVAPISFDAQLVVGPPAAASLGLTFEAVPKAVSE
jgi:hypothetical protein